MVSCGPRMADAQVVVVLPPLCLCPDEQLAQLAVLFADPERY